MRDERRAMRPSRSTCLAASSASMRASSASSWREVASSSSTWFWLRATSTTIDTIWVLTASRLALISLSERFVLEMRDERYDWLAARVLIDAFCRAMSFSSSLWRA
jgi:hypothetical protein